MCMSSWIFEYYSNNSGISVMTKMCNPALLLVGLISVALFHINHVTSFQLREDNKLYDFSSEDGPKLMYKRTTGTCDSFVHLPNRLSYVGQELKRVGDGYTVEECQDVCTSTTSFFCNAVQIHKPALCFTMGYKLRDDYLSTYFYRFCEEGPKCFKAFAGKSAGFTRAQSIPRYLSTSARMASYYCVAQCQRKSSCVGFDLRMDENRPRCVFQDVGVLHDTSFDLYVRRCKLTS